MSIRFFVIKISNNMNKIISIVTITMKKKN